VAAPIGLRINNYEITSMIGEGGMGAVYLAVHPVMRRKAAIKLLRRELAQDKSLVSRFVNEARAASAIDHPNIIDVIDVGTLPADKGDGLPYMMMEFLDGESLARRLEQRGRLEVAEAVDVAIQTASALGAAHAKGIVHRDLKPDNLFLVADEMNPGRQRVKVLDFGIAKLRGDIAGDSVKTSAGSIMGTPPYMSPEQCRGIVEEVDHRTDVYALGIILYEMLCGAPPFVSSGYGEVLVMHLTQPPPPPRSKNPAIPEGLEQTMLRTLAKRPEERFASMAELQTALGRVPTAGNWRAVHMPTPVEAAATMLPTPPPRAATPAPRAPTPAPSDQPLTPKSTTFSATTGIIEGVEGHRSRRPWLVAGGVAALVVAGGLAARAILRPAEPVMHAGGVPLDLPRAVTPPPPAPVVPAPAPEPPRPAPVAAPAPPSEPAAAGPARRPPRRPGARHGKAVAAEGAAPVASPPPAVTPAPAPTAAVPAASPPAAKKAAEKW
jgi:eukaryotic-like serine/threonine-protein kinase